MSTRRAERRTWSERPPRDSAWMSRPPALFGAPVQLATVSSLHAIRPRVSASEFQNGELARQIATGATVGDVERHGDPTSRRRVYRRTASDARAGH